MRHALLLVATLGVAPSVALGEEKADELARDVVEAAGDPYQEAFVSFSFVVEQDGEELLRRRHDWCPQRGLVEVDGVRISAIDGAAVGSTDAGAAKQAWGGFVNDAYWIFAPAKLMDPGVKRELLDDGRLRISFGQVGLTPGDVYTLSFDDEKRLVRWDFTLQSGKKGAFSWEDYIEVGGLRVAQSHHAQPEGSGPSILIDGLRVGDACPL